MNKLKLSAQALRDHLGSDSRGVALLQNLIDVANKQRKQCASLEHELSKSKESAEKSNASRDKAETELKALQVRLNNEITKRRHAESKSRLLENTISSMQEAEPLEKVNGKDFVKSVEKLLRRVRRRYKIYPGPNIEDYITKFTDDEFTGLGMAIACITFFCGKSLQIVSDKEYAKEKKKVSAPQEYESWPGEKTWEYFGRWLGPNGIAPARSKLEEQIANDPSYGETHNYRKHW